MAAFSLFRSGKRERLRASPFPDDWRRTIERNVPIVLRLPPADRQELFGHVQVFLAEKHFEGVGGLELTDEIRVTIAAQACLLLLHRETDYYPELTSILVYPSGYLAGEDRYLGDNIWEQGEEGRFGHTGRPGRRRKSGSARVRASARFRRLADGRRACSHESR